MFAEQLTIDLPDPATIPPGGWLVVGLVVWYTLASVAVRWIVRQGDWDFVDYVFTRFYVWLFSPLIMAAVAIYFAAGVVVWVISLGAVPCWWWPRGGAATDPTPRKIVPPQGGSSSARPHSPDETS